MFNRILYRAFSFTLAAVLTAGMLGGIDNLSQPEDGAPQWAQQTAASARG